MTTVRRERNSPANPPSFKSGVPAARGRSSGSPRGSEAAGEGDVRVEPRGLALPSKRPYGTRRRRFMSQGGRTMGTWIGRNSFGGAAGLAVLVGVLLPSVALGAQGSMLLPTAEERTTARWLTVKARGDVAGLTGVKFQYRARRQRDWSDITPNLLRTERGEVVTSPTQALSGGVSPTMLLDVPRMVDQLGWGGALPAEPSAMSLTADEPIPPPPPSRPGVFQLRAVFVGGPGGTSDAIGRGPPDRLGRRVCPMFCVRSG
jgi:hypothetical protein